MPSSTSGAIAAVDSAAIDHQLIPCDPVWLATMTGSVFASDAVNSAALANVLMILSDNKVSLVSIRSVGQQTEQAFLDLVEKEESRGFARLYQADEAA